MCKKVIMFCAVALVLAAVTPSWSNIVQDDFNTPVNYLTAAFPAGIWNGVIGKLANEQALAINADMNDANGLYLSDLGASWEGGGNIPPANNRGPFLYRNVNAKYWIMTTRIQAQPSSNVFWNVGGLLARAKYIPTLDGSVLDEAGTGEDFVLNAKFPVLNAMNVHNLNDGAEGEWNPTGLYNYLKMSKVGATIVVQYGDGTSWLNSSYTGSGASNRTDMNGLELQLGIAQCSFSEQDGDPNWPWMSFGEFTLMYQGPGQAWKLSPAMEATDVDSKPLLSWEKGSSVQAVNGHLIFLSKVRSEVENRIVSPITTTDPCYQVTTLLDPGTKYYWAVDEANGATTVLDDVWSFTTAKAQGSNPQPSDSAGGIPVSLAQVSWTPYKYADGQAIVFSATLANVQNNVGSVTLASGLTSSWNGFTKPLEVQQTYYWKIRSLVGATYYDGPIWSFTTAFPINFCDTFSNSWDYWGSGGSTAGTIWDGVIGESQLNVMNTDTTPGQLRIESTGGWDGRTNQGVLLYKEVDVPYIATVEITNINGLLTTGHTGAIAGQRSGLMARLADLTKGWYGNQTVNRSDEDWVSILFYPTYGVGNMGEVQGWHFNKTGSTSGQDTRREFGQTWLNWPTDPFLGVYGSGYGDGSKQQSGRWVQIDYKGHGDGVTNDGKAGHFYVRWGQNGSVWYPLKPSTATYNGRVLNSANVDRYGDMNGFPHQVGIMADNSGGFTEFDNFCLGRNLQAKASAPYPPVGGSMDIMKADMQWNPGDLALDQDFFFDINSSVVLNATATRASGIPVPPYRGNSSDGIYSGIGSPGPTGMYPRYRYDVATQETLTLGTTYYWRVDEVNGTTVWKGDVWNFTILSYANVDRFDQYTTTGDVGGSSAALRRTWIDGYVGVAAQSGWVYPTRPTPEGSSGSYVQISNDACDGNTTTANQYVAGGKSMKFYYDNDGVAGWLISLLRWPDPTYYWYAAPKYSEASAAIDDAALLTDDSRYLYPGDQSSLGLKRDWTSYKLLRVSYYGDFTNTKVASDKLYVGLSDGDGTKVIVNCPDSDAAMHPGWHTWYIRLKDYNGIDANLNLADVARIYIGVGNPASPATGGKGCIFLDEVRLLTTSECAPVTPADVEKTAVVGDFSFDCATNASDLRLMSYLWLGEGFAGNTPPTPPIIKLDASGLALGTLTAWPNTGSAGGNFVDFNSPQTGYRPTVMANVEGKKAVWFDGNDIMRGDFNTPLSITGSNPWTVIATIYRSGSVANSFDMEIFVWGKRGTSNRQGAFTYSTNGYGSFAGWGAADRGWTRYFPASHQWHQLAITFGGGSPGAFYAMSDGQVVTPNTPITGLDIWTDPYGNGLLMSLGNAYEGNSALTSNITAGGYWFTGGIAKLEVYNYFMTPGQIAFLMGTPMDMSSDANNAIDFKDVAIFANNWMVGPVLLGD